MSRRGFNSKPQRLKPRSLLRLNRHEWNSCPSRLIYLQAFSFWEIAMRRVVVDVVVVALLLGAVIEWQSWRRRQELHRQLDYEGKEIKCMKGRIDIRTAELSCAEDLTKNGQSLPQAVRYCHLQRAGEWQSWARACPDQYKQMVENHEIVETTQ